MGIHIRAIFQHPFYFTKIERLCFRIDGKQ